MTERELNRTAEELLEVRDNDIVTNYQPHDIAQHVLIDRLEGAGYVVEQHGTDDRHGEVKFGDGPDLAVYELDEEAEGENLLGYVEVKSKRAGNEEWFGRLNRRHFEEYLSVARESPVPVFIYFAVVDMDEGMVTRDGFIEVQSPDQIETGLMSKGNAVVCLDETDTRNFTWLYYRLDEQLDKEITHASFAESS